MADPRKEVATEERSEDVGGPESHPEHDLHDYGESGSDEVEASADSIGVFAEIEGVEF